MLSTSREIALAVFLRHGFQGLDELPRLERVGAAVDLADGQLVRRHAGRVLGLHDALYRPVGGADDPPVALGVELLGCQDRGRRALALVGGHQLAERVGGDERMVAREHDDGARLLDRLARREHGGGRALPLQLLDHLDSAVELLGHTLARPRDAHDACRSGIASGLRHPQDHRAAADGVKHLGQRRAHARAVAGRHDQDGHFGSHRAASVTGAHEPAGRRAASR